MLWAGVVLEDVFTTDPRESPIHVQPWGFLGESWPFFRPNFVNMEQLRSEHAVDEVGLLTCMWRLRIRCQKACRCLLCDGGALQSLLTLKHLRCMI